MTKKLFLFLLFTVFILSFLIRILTINQMGRTWDEGPYVEQGYMYISLLKKGDLTNEYWYKNPDHPLLTRYFYGIATHFDGVEKKNGELIFKYDYTYARLVSIFVACLSILLVMLIGAKYFTRTIGIFSGVLLSLLPLFIGYSQIATLESFITFFFTLSVFTYLYLLEKPTLKRQIFAGIAIGMALMVKQSNLLLIPLLICIHFLWNTKSKEKVSYWYILNILGIGFITFFLLWPMPFLNLDYVIAFHNNMWLPDKPLPPPELIFGRFMLTPPFYYLLSLLITTPLLMLIFLTFGIFKILKRREKIDLILLIWFLLPFIQSFYFFRQHGIRYIIEIYAPLAIIAAIGLEQVINRSVKTQTKKILLTLVIIFYLLFIAYKASPYYLTYFNKLVGGTRNVFEKKIFLLGWWGEGMKETGEYLKKNAPKDTSIGVAISPYKVFPPLPDHKVEEYNKEKKYDFVVVSYFNVLREKFDDSQIKKEYKLAYSVNADGAELVNVYKRK